VNTARMDRLKGTALALGCRSGPSRGDSNNRLRLRVCRHP
jgi:hypothetical protein